MYVFQSAHFENSMSISVDKQFKIALLVTEVMKRLKFNRIMFQYKSISM
jgi:hypothetical protein